jgi:hypothetical protein
MKIPVCNVHNATNRGTVCCPGCHGWRCRKHGFYRRKGFHAPNGAVAIPVIIQRYLCLNPQCARKTFSIPPPGVLPYCRFLWANLLAVKHALGTGVSRYHLARYVWHVGRAVIVRAAAALDHMAVWLSEMYRELSDGRTAHGLERMVRFIAVTIGRLELSNRWCRHRYPVRFYQQNRPTQKSV